jgi:hypothetical protein
MKLHLNPKIKNKVMHYLYYGMRFIVMLSVVGFFIFRDWMSMVNAILILFLMLIPRLIKSVYSIYLPFGLELAIVGFIFLSVFLGSLRNYYEKFPLWDGILHFQSGMLLGVVGFVVVYVLNTGTKTKLTMSPGFVAFFAVCFSLAMSVAWEVFEYAGDSWFGYTMQESGLPDTMGDLIVNGAGAIVVAVLGYLWMKKSKQLPFSPEKFTNQEIA